MASSELVSELKNRVGESLGGAHGVVCLRTACQDIIPKALAKDCKQEARGKEARKLCRPFLQECQGDQEMKQDCKHKCARYFQGEELNDCERDCAKQRCMQYQPYDGCVATETMRLIMECLHRTEWRGKAERCLKERCNVKMVDKDSEPSVSSS